MGMTGLLDRLNAAQREAVLHIDGPLLMLAGPGSGKTRVITHRIAHMIQQGVPAWNILGLTFTNKAADEMKLRLKKLVGDSPLWLGTFHSYCARLLRRYSRLVGLPENFTIYDADDAEMALKASVKLAEVELTHITIGSLAQKISHLKNRLVTPEMLLGNAVSHDEHLVARVYPIYQQYLLRSGAVDFDDLLMHCAIMLRSSSELRAELDCGHKYILVDEYQDTNLAQYAIIKSLSIDHPNLAVTGDPDQSIYGWRGANLNNILNFEKDFPKTRVIRLEENYRSTPEILSVADVLIQNNQKRKAKNLRPTRPSGNKVRLKTYLTSRDEASDIVQQIMTACQQNGASLRDFAVLYRTNAQSRLMELALRKANLGYLMIGGFQFYQRKEIKDLLSYLHLLHNPADDIAFQRVINTPPRGLGKQTLANLEELARKHGVSLLEGAELAIDRLKLAAKAKKSLVEFLKLMDVLREQSKGRLTDLLQTLITKVDYRNYLTKIRREEADADVMENIDELLSDAAELDNQDLQGNPLEIFLEQAALYAETDRLDSDAERVHLMTLHAAKGLEFPYVFIIAVEQDILPHRRCRQDPLQMEEERRLLFVGMTRAKEELQLSCAQSRSFRGNQNVSAASMFLMELPRAEMQISDLTDRWEAYNDSWDHGEEAFDDFFDRHFSKEKEEGAEGVADSRNARRKMGEEDPGLEHHFDQSSSELDNWENGSSEKLGKRLTAGKERVAEMLAAKQLRTGSEVSDETEGLPAIPPEAFRPNAIVSHPTYGSGKITSASGRGLRRTVTVEFFSDGVSRSFVLKFAKLTLESMD
jgi:DNA helicase-2/ATP-dependent DNA helicase PcrA